MSQTHIQLQTDIIASLIHITHPGHIEITRLSDLPEGPDLTPLMSPTPDNFHRLPFATQWFPQRQLPTRGTKRDRPETGSEVSDPLDEIEGVLSQKKPRKVVPDKKGDKSTPAGKSSKPVAPSDKAKDKDNGKDKDKDKGKTAKSAAVKDQGTDKAGHQKSKSKDESQSVKSKRSSDDKAAESPRNGARPH